MLNECKGAGGQTFKDTFASPGKQKRHTSACVVSKHESAGSSFSSCKLTILNSPAKKYQKISKFDRGIDERSKEPLKVNKNINNTLKSKEQEEMDQQEVSIKDLSTLCNAEKKDGAIADAQIALHTKPHGKTSVKVGSGSSKKNSKRKSKTKRAYPFLNQNNNSSKKTKPFAICDENASKLKKAIIKISDSQKLRDFDCKMQNDENSQQSVGVPQ